MVQFIKVSTVSNSLYPLGYWKDNKASGKGEFLHANGEVYEGEWSNDKANGYGTIIHVNGTKYEG